MAGDSGTAKLFGSFPFVNESKYLPPSEDSKIRASIMRLWMSNQSPGAVLMVHGESGIGKSALLSHVTHDSQFLETLPGLEAVFWFHACRTSPFNEETFLIEISSLLREGGIQVSSSSLEALVKSLGKIKRYLLIIDDAFNRKISSFTSQLYDSIRTVLIYRNRAEIGHSSPGEQCFVSNFVTLEPDELLALTCANVPEEILDNEESAKHVAQLTRGLPLIARVLSTHFNENLTIGARFRAKKETPQKKYEKLYALALQHRPSNVLRCAFKHLKKKDRLRYYAFLLMDPGHYFCPRILGWLWRKTKEVDIYKICQRFVEIGIAYRVEDKTTWTGSFAISAYFHAAAEQLALETDVTGNLADLRRILMEGTLMVTKLPAKFVQQMFRRKFRPSENILQTAVDVEDWRLVQAIFEGAGDFLLLRLSCDSKKPYLHALKMLYLKCPYSRRVQQLFLQIVEQLTQQRTGVRRKEIEIVRYLESKRLVVDERYIGGENALMIAAKDGNYDVASFLIENGEADLTERNDDNATVLIRAAKFGQLLICKLLLWHGAELGDRDNEGMTAIMWASKFGHLSVVRFLHGEGDDLTRCDATGATALMWAAKFGHIDVVKYLVYSGADILATNFEGQSAYTMAMWHSPFYGDFRELERRQVADYLRQFVET